MIVSAHDGYPRWLNSGADFIEMDIRRGRRGVIVLAHDRLRWWRRYVRLDEVLKEVPPTAGLHLDVKETGFERELLGRLLERWPAEKVVVTPDFEQSVRAIKTSFANVRVSPLHFLVLDHTYATDESIAKAGKPVWLWTVDDPVEMERYIEERKVEGIVTNRPDLALKLRSARS